MGLTYLRFKRKVKKGARTFRKELIRSGLDRECAAMLTEEYTRTAETFSVRNLGGILQGGGIRIE